MVLRKGDPDAGGILVVLHGRDGLSVLSQIRAADGARPGCARTGAAPVDQEAADAYVARQVGFDPDLWVLEFEAPGPAAARSRQGLAFFSGRGRVAARRGRLYHGP